MNPIVVEATALFLGTVAAAALIGGFRWVRAVTVALSKLADVAEQLADVTHAVSDLRDKHDKHQAEADTRWARLVGAVPHPGFLVDELHRERRRHPRVPEPAGPVEL